MRLFLVTIFVLFSLSARAIVGGTDVPPEKRGAFRAIVLLRLDGHGVCTASHLGGGRLLTAYHCLLDSPALEIKDVEEKPLARVEAKDYERLSPKAVYVEEVELPSGKTGTIPQPDLAVIVIKDPDARRAVSALPVAKLRFTPIPEKTERLVVGFGFEDFAPEGAIGFATGKARTAKLEFLHYLGIWEKGAGVASIAHGDSGGPLVVMEDGKPVTFAIASTMNTLRKDGKVEYRHVRLDVDGVREWLANQLP